MHSITFRCVIVRLELGRYRFLKSVYIGFRFLVGISKVDIAISLLNISRHRYRFFLYELPVSYPVIGAI